MKDLIPNRAENRRLGGDNITPKTVAEARQLIGKRVEYLRGRDIDYSGRGYYFPRTGTITDASGRNIEMDGDWIFLSDFDEMRLIEPPTTTGEKP